MELTPSEHDRLLIFTAAQLAASRRDRGLLLNLPEATALIAHEVIEQARSGATHAQALEAGAQAVLPGQLLPGVLPMLHGISVEAVFDDGRRLVVVDIAPGDIADDEVTPGEVVRLAPLSPAPERERVELEVLNTASVRISVTTHFHFFEVNPRLSFDRQAAYGMHLALPAGEHVDFEPGLTTHVQLTPIRGDRVAIGFAGLVDGALDAPGAKERAIAKAEQLGYLSGGESE